MIAATNKDTNGYAITCSNGTVQSSTTKKRTATENGFMPRFRCLHRAIDCLVSSPDAKSFETKQGNPVAHSGPGLLGTF
jgi:hypothetical protein